MPPRVEPHVQLGEKVERVGGQDRVRAGDARRRGRDVRPVEDGAHTRASCVIT